MNEHKLLNIIGSTADRHRVQVWAVGGFVRDKILNKTVKDIDFVVVGDGPGFAKIISKQLNTRNIVVYPKFGTAMVNFQDYHLEFVTAKSESYHETSSKKGLPAMPGGPYAQPTND